MNAHLYLDARSKASQTNRLYTKHVIKAQAYEKNNTT